MGFLSSLVQVLLGCCLNAISLEYIAKFDTGGGYLFTVTQFFCISLFAIMIPYFEFYLLCSKSAPKPSLPFNQPLTLPLKSHMQMAILFFALSVVNNKALDYHISMPLHMIFRSSSLVTTLLVGVIAFSKRYSFGQWLGCFLVSIGIFIATIADAVSRGKLTLSCCSAWFGHTAATAATGSAAISPDSMLAGIDWSALTQSLHEAAQTVDVIWLQGVGLIILALLMTSSLSFMQEANFKAHGKNWQEAMLYSHMLALPYFLFFADDIYQRLIRWYLNPYFEATLPWPFDPTIQRQFSIWWILFLNVATQFVCVRGVFSFMGQVGALTSSLILTLRKFISLLISIVLFNHPFTALHWIGTSLVFGGSLVYSHLKCGDDANSAKSQESASSAQKKQN